MTDAHLKHYVGMLEGFTNHRISAKGTIGLEVVLDEGNQTRTKIISFFVINMKSPIISSSTSLSWPNFR